MAKLNLRSAYLYLVCLVTLIVFIFGIIFAITNLTDLLLDEGYYTTYEDYVLRFQKFDPERNQSISTLSEEELQERYAQFRQAEEKRQRNQDIKDFVNSIAAMLVGGGFWIYHWRKIDGSENNSQN